MSEEKWRAVVGWEGLYTVSSLGRVRTERKDRLMKPNLDTDGYPVVPLSFLGVVKRRKVAVLVLEAFVKPRPFGKVCRHLDGNRSNSRLDNLAWGTHRENVDDMRAHGTVRRGDKTARAKLSQGDIHLIRERCLARKSEGKTLDDIGAEFGVTKGAIWCVEHGKTWSWVERDATDTALEYRKV